ncbi:MAG: hypothetical protein HY749_15890 [Gammaproteobacteria bacterium]|nr:hypothetical protein [Gammaproteobacteria bacterium]
MANRLEIIISAADKASATLRKIQQSTERFLKPLERTKQSFKTFGRALGVDELGKSLVHAGDAASDVGEKFRRLAEPIAALTGIGGFAAAAEAVKGFAESSERLTNVAAAIGAPVAKLQALEGAARLAGVGTEALDGSLASLGRTLQDASAGRNVEAFYLMDRIGLRLHRTKSGAVDAARALKDLSKYLSSAKVAGNPQVQAMVASHFGVEQLMPLLRRGPGAIDELMAQAQRSSGISGEAIERGNRFAETLHGLTESALGLRSAIGDKLIPAVSPMLEQLTKWIDANKQLIATRMGEMASGLAAALTQVNWGKIGKDIEGIAGAAARVATAVGGWGNAMLGLFAIMNAGTLWKVGKAVWFVGEAFGGVALRSVALFGATLASSVIGAAPAAVAALATIRTAALGLGASLSASGLIAATGGVAAAGAIGLGLGALANTGISKGLTKLTGRDASLGTWLYDLTHGDGSGARPAAGPMSPTPLARASTSQAASGNALPAPVAAAQAMRIELYIPNGSPDMRVRTNAPDNVIVDLHLGYAMPTP